MSSEGDRRKIARLQRGEAGLRDDLAGHVEDETKARAKASRERARADRASSPTARRSAERRAKNAEEKASKATDKAATVSDKLASNSRSQASARRHLETAGRTEQRQQDRHRDRRDAQWRRREIAHAHAVARAAQPTTPLPEPETSTLRVLYLTANPEATERDITYPDGAQVHEGTWLRTEAEVAQVRRTLRGSRYRDQVQLEHRPAATTEDLFDGLNDVRPHAVHFSGHADPAGIVLDNSSAADPEGVDLSFDVLADILAATATLPRLVVLNACSSLAGADALLHVVPIVVAMSDTIDDPAAVAFAQRFWAALASAQPVGAAFDQAKAAMRAALFEDDAQRPELLCRDDVDPTTTVLVTP